ncbi:MAG: hypothetical protein AAGD35_06690 [Actinomycetota bacterium]
MTELLAGLTGKDVVTKPSDGWTPHEATLRGLVNAENELKAVIGCDLDFAHRSAAALAMVPSGSVKDPAEEPEDHLIEIYGEVANVMSQLPNEASTERLRLDPGLAHATDTLQAFVESGTAVVSVNVDLDNYFTGNVAIWGLAE